MAENYYKNFIEHTDCGYSYRFAKRMEKNNCNQDLGYRTSGSDAELATAELIAQEMKNIGLSHVTKDEITTDGWNFSKADMYFTDSTGKEHVFKLGSYQTNFDTKGVKSFEVVYLGKGTAKDYDGVDVKDKLVLVDIDQRNEWWICYPVYQAYLKGAAALIAVQCGGYGQIDDAALNAQDIAGPDYAAAFSISRSDAGVLKEEIEQNGFASVRFDATSKVWRGASTYNVWGEIEGEDSDSAVMLSAHFDSYFIGFQDDNSAIAMMLSIARTFVQMGYKPKKTIRFCAFAAEEWGIINSKYDWSCGAYAQLFSKRTQWRGKTYAGLNFELPACRHGDRDALNCSYEYNKFYLRAIGRIPLDKSVFKEGVSVMSPVETWSDDFTISISGIPSSVNSFSNSEFMTTTYHSQFDNDDNYSEDVYRYHHVLYGGLVIALDRCSVAPLDFSERFDALKGSLGVHGNTAELRALFDHAQSLASLLYRKISKINLRRKKRSQFKRFEEKLLAVFAECENAYVRLNWDDDVCFPHEILETDISYIESAICALSGNKPNSALKSMYSIDNNRYAFEFDKQVFTYFSQYVLEQPASRLQWGAGRVICHENLFNLIADIRQKTESGITDFTEQIIEAKQICKRMNDVLEEVIRLETENTRKILSDIEAIIQDGVLKYSAPAKYRVKSGVQNKRKKTKKTATKKTASINKKTKTKKRVAKKKKALPKREVRKRVSSKKGMSKKSKKSK